MCGRQQRHPRALTVAEHGDALVVHVLPFRQPPDDAPQVLGEIGNRRGFAAASALTVPTLVVADREEAGLRNGAGEVREDRHTEERPVSIVGVRAADEDHGGHPRGCVRRTRHRRAEIEAGRGDDDRFIAGIGRHVRA